MTELGHRLADARKMLDMTQADIATRTGLKVSAVSHFECGRRKPSVDNLVRLSKVLRVSTDWLLCVCKRPLGCDCPDCIEKYGPIHPGNVGKDLHHGRGIGPHSPRNA